MCFKVAMTLSAIRSDDKEITCNDEDFNTALFLVKEVFSETYSCSDTLGPFALKRADTYSKAGADAILIHSKEKTPAEIFSFAKEFKKSKNFIPLVSVPSTYSKVYEKDLIRKGFKLVIYANQLLRAAYPAMQYTAKKILENSRAFEVEKKIIPIKEIINLIKND